LMHACAVGNLAMVQALAAKGAHSGAKDLDEWQPLTFAADGGHWHVCDYMMRDRKHLKAEPTLTRTGDTLLMRAAANGHELCVQYLATLTDKDLGRRGDRTEVTPIFNINSQNKDGNTALMLAVFFGRLQVVRYLSACKDIKKQLHNQNWLKASQIRPSRFAVEQYMASHKSKDERVKKRADLAEEELTQLLWKAVEENDYKINMSKGGTNVCEIDCQLITEIIRMYRGSGLGEAEQA